MAPGPAALPDTLVWSTAISSLFAQLRNFPQNPAVILEQPEASDLSLANMDSESGLELCLIDLMEHPQRSCETEHRETPCHWNRFSVRIKDKLYVASGSGERIRLFRSVS